MLRLGRHISVAGGLDIAFDRAEEMGCTAMQIFTTNPRSWSINPIGPDAVGKFTGRYEKSSLEDVIAHMPYLPNLSSPNKAIYDKSVVALRSNLERCDALGISCLVTHMGSHMGAGTEKAIGNISAALEAVEDVAPDVKILLENEAGHSNSVGADILEMRRVYDLVGGDRVGFCLDTCHMFAMGYDIRDRKVLSRLDREIDFRNVHAIHVNDAKMELGARRDRHENIGMGYIGIDGFRKFLAYGDIKSKILILETAPSEKMSEEEEIASVRSLIKA